jgi:hypothetical protein
LCGGDADGRLTADEYFYAAYLSISRNAAPPWLIEILPNLPDEYQLSFLMVNGSKLLFPLFI